MKGDTALETAWRIILVKAEMQLVAMARSHAPKWEQYHYTDRLATLGHVVMLLEKEQKGAGR